MRDVYVIGAGLTRFGELWDLSLRDLFAQAAIRAIVDAKVDRVDGMYVGCMSSGLLIGQEHTGSLLAEWSGVLPAAAVRVESACASGGMAFRSAYFEVASGASDVVIAGGVEKTTDVADLTEVLGAATDREYEAFHGATLAGLFAMMARAHMSRHGTTREQIAEVAVKNQKHAANNPQAQMRSIVTVQQVLGSPMVADPLRLLDCAPVCDGAACTILGSEEQARKSGKPKVKVTGVGAATDKCAVHARTDPTWLSAVATAAAKAYAMSSKRPGDIHLAEVHDSFTIAEIMAIEALGLVDRGQAGAATVSGETSLGGRIPVNVSGGLKAKGHPIGATGTAQICEILTQLRGEAGARQVQGARVGLAQNMGGTGGSATVHILEVD
jgi:acetyl-CoA C-acetyltransferase